MRTSYNFCVNCGNQDHLINKCIYPIISNGIIAFTYNKNDDENENNKIIDLKNKKIEYLIIRRKHSFGYIDLIRGKYPITNINYLQNMINEMTLEEKENILKCDYEELYELIWNTKLTNKNDEKISISKYNSLKKGMLIDNEKITFEYLINNSNTKWTEQEWGFPKGRRVYQENDIKCALREFEEETGYNKNNLNIITNVNPYEEIFTGMNFKSYKHKYYLGYIKNKMQYEKFQDSEVSSMCWCSYEELLKKLRNYNSEKIEVITKINKLLNEYRLYC